jgi:hypothetical protein
MSTGLYRESTQQITVEQYVSTLPYEIMPLKENFFTNIFDNENIKRIFKGSKTAPLTKEEIRKTLEGHRNTFIQYKNKDVLYDMTNDDTSLNNNVIRKEIFNYLLNYRLFELYSSTEDIASAKVALQSVGSTSDIITSKKVDLKKVISDLEKLSTRTAAQNASLNKTKDDLGTLERNEALATNRTLYILPKIYSPTNQPVGTNLNINIIDPYKKYYSEILNSNNDNIFFLSVFSNNNEDLETFKSRMDQDFINLTEKIKIKGRDEKTAYNKIIYYINNTTDKLFYTDFFKRTLKKEFIADLNTRLKNFCIGRIGSQQLRLYTTPYYNDIEKLKSEMIVRNLKASLNLPILKDILNDNLFKLAIQLLVDSIKDCYLSYTDAKFRKSLSENANINTFNIYTRLENLDDSDPTNTVIASNDYYYIFLEPGHDPRVGKFQVSNESKQQYFFVVDRQKGVFKKWKTTNQLDASGNPKKFEPSNPDTWSKEFTQYKKIYNEGKTEKSDDNSDDDTLEKQDRNETRILVQIRYNFGQIQFKNIQEKINTKFNGVIQFHKIVRLYEMYDWFKYNSIDRTFDRNKSEISYYSDTIFDKTSLIAFLKSENKWSDKTRISLEFLKLNSDVAQLKKYSDFIYDNYKGNINQNVNLNSEDTSFEENIKRSILEILFDKNGLIYIKPTNIVAEKEKEKADADNYKILNYDYVSINKKTADQDISKYFNRNNQEEGNRLKNRDKNIKELTGVCKQYKKTVGIVIVQITRDVIGDTSGMLIKAECKKRTKRIKSKMQKAFDYIFQGGKTMPLNKKRKTRTKSKRSKKYYRT